MFEGCTLEHIDVGPVVLRVRHGGAGPAVVLLHGHPCTHATWHEVAVALADQFTVVCPDLRGYGGSGVPADQPEHAQMSKKAMAGDVVSLMHRLGHRRFAVVGHDRGALVGFRLALDHPEAVSHLVNIGGPPAYDALRLADERFARKWWHWFFLGQTEKPAEEFINRDPDAWYGGKPDHCADEVFSEYRTARHDPRVVHAMCEDYRAGLTADRRDDEADKAAGRKINCPILVVWGKHDDLPDLYGDPAEPWHDWATDVHSRELDAGHHVQEERSAELTETLKFFLQETARRGMLAHPTDH
ncbi:alpha/beta hydrolase [Streptomyces sp. NPDC006368]|uniref:alpha/beta fold hydrolase n=1 Tax=Streptomyces sp. NPDC006368 TaxID=3156760 RepID=UPI0033B31086